MLGRVMLLERTGRQWDRRTLEEFNVTIVMDSDTSHAIAQIAVPPVAIVSKGMVIAGMTTLHAPMDVCRQSKKK